MKEMTKLPKGMEYLLQQGCIVPEDILHTRDGFFAVFHSVSDILATHEIDVFPDSKGELLRCDKFFDDWYLYALPFGQDYTYSLFKLREQEDDASYDVPADGDTPAVTISFIAFDLEVLVNCLNDPTMENRRNLSNEINRVVAHRGQTHHDVLKAYFVKPEAEGAYLVADLYTKHIASFAKDGFVEVPEHYRKIVKKYAGNKEVLKSVRIPGFLERLNAESGRCVCDHKRIYIQNKESLEMCEKLAILATHTGNVSFHSFGAEVEFHAKFLIPIAKIRVPLIRRSVYDSAIRADMTIEGNAMDRFAPYYRLDSGMVKKHMLYHPEYSR